MDTMTIADQLIMKSRAIIAETAVKAMNPILAALVFDPFLNFIENIGISLTSSMERITDAAGMNQTLSTGRGRVIWLRLKK